MKIGDTTTKNQLSEIDKKIQDIITKYTERAKKYDNKLFTKARRIVEDRETEKTVQLSDINEIREKIKEKTKNILEHGDISQKIDKEGLFSPKNVEMKEIDAIREAQKILKKDIPELLRKQNFSFPLYMTKGAMESDGTIFRENMKNIVTLKEMEIYFLFSFVHTVYKKLPAIIRGGESTNEKKD